MKIAKLSSLEGERNADDAFGGARTKKLRSLGSWCGGDGSARRIVKAERLGRAVGHRPMGTPMAAARGLKAGGPQGKAAARASFCGKRAALQWLFALSFALVGGVPSTFAEEWDCAEDHGAFQLSADCTMGDGVAVDGDLAVTGKETVYSTLTAASGKRHFKIDSGAPRVSLKWLNLTGADVSGNDSPNNLGGSIFVSNAAAQVNISHCVFFNNRALHGGAVYATDGGHATLFFSSVFFESNTAVTMGGAVVLNRAMFKGERNSFLRNSGEYGGAIYVDKGSVFSSTHSMYVKNSAKYIAGAMFVLGDSTYPTKLNLTRVKLTQNTQTGGGISSDRGGGGLALQSLVTANIRECTFVQNKATTGLVGQKHGHQIMTFKSNASIPIIALVNTNFTGVTGSYPFYGHDDITKTGGKDTYVRPIACASNPCSASPFTGECFNISAGVLCGIADNYSPSCSWGQVKANVTAALLPPQLCTCPVDLYFNGTACLTAPIITSVTPAVAIPNSTDFVSFAGSFEGTFIDLSIGRGQWTKITRVSSTKITAIPPTGIGGQLYQLYVTVNGIRALAAFNFSYVAPNITKVISPPFAGGIVKILGDHFGSVLDEITISVSGKGACPIPCEKTQWTDGGVACQYNAPGKQDLEMDVRVTVGPKGHEQPSNLAGYQYEFDKGTLTGIPEGRQRVPEGANLTYRLALTSNIAPTQDNVTVLFTASGCTVSRTVVTFLVKQEETYLVVVSTTNNKVDEGTDIGYSCSVTHTIETTDRHYKDNLPKALEIDVLNDDKAGMKLWALESNGAPAYDSKVLSFYMEEGNKIEYLITLDTEPRANVSVHLNIAPRKATIYAPEVVAVPAVAQFSRSSWSTYRTIRIQSIDDNVDFPLTDFEVLHTVVSEDGEFQKKINAQRIVALLQVNDNDTAGVHFASDAPLNLLEGGRPGSITISGLRSEPLSNVYVHVDMPQGGLELVSETPITVQRISWAKVSRTIDLRAPVGAFNAAGENTMYLRLRLQSLDAKYNKTIAANMIIVRPSKDSVPPPSQPTVRVGSGLFVMALKWTDESNVGDYEVQWSENREFSNRANITRTNSTEIELQVPDSVATKVVYSRVRKLLRSGEESAWSVVSNGWATTGSCDYARQYLNASSKSPLRWKCTGCPEGASCDGAITWDGVVALFGWWRHSSVHGFSNFTQCSSPPACLGARNFAFEGKYTDVDGDDIAVLNHKESCNKAFGYASVCTRRADKRCRLCATCAEGYRRLDGGAMQCLKCPKSGVNWFLMTVGAILAFLIVSSMVIDHMISGGTIDVPNMQQIIVINYFQLTYMIAGTNVAWPNALKIIFDIEGAFSTIGEHLLNPACELTTVPAAEIVYSKQIAYMLVLPCLIGFFKLVWRLLAMCQGRSFRYRGVDGRSPSHKDGSVATIVYIVYLLYPTLCRQAFGLLVCKEVNGVYYLEADMQEECYTGRHMYYLFFCTLPQIVFHVVGLPIQGLRAAKRGQKKREKMHFSISLFRYGMLYSAYGPGRWFWEAVIASRKAMIVLVTSLFDDAGQEVHWLILFLAVSIMLNLFLQPYIGATGINENDALGLQRFDSTALFVLLVTAWSGVYFDINRSCSHEEEVTCSILLVCVVALNTGFLCFCLYQFRSKLVSIMAFTVDVRSCGKTKMVAQHRRNTQRRNSWNTRHQNSRHLNPLVYNAFFVQKQVFENPMLAIGGLGDVVAENPDPEFRKKRVGGKFVELASSTVEISAAGLSEWEGKVVEMRRMRAQSRENRSMKIRRLTSFKKQPEGRSLEWRAKMVEMRSFRAQSRSERLKKIRRIASFKIQAQRKQQRSYEEGSSNQTRKETKWLKALDQESGKEFYYNEETREAAWELPDGCKESQEEDV